MFKGFKINIVVLICAIFLVRLLSGNIGIVSFSNTKQNSDFVKANVSTTLKSSVLVETQNNLVNHIYSIADCEEAPDDDNEFKPNHSFLIQVLYSLITGSTENELAKMASASKYSHLSSPLYIVFSVFRV